MNTGRAGPWPDLAPRIRRIYAHSMRANPRHDPVRVRGGRTKKKNNWRLDPGDYHALEQSEIRLHRRHPGAGFRHVVTVPQLRAFLPLLPDWDEVAVGLDAIVLDAGREDYEGWCRPGVVALRAWPRGLWHHDANAWYLYYHREIFELIGLEQSYSGGQVHLHWTEAQARAYLLVHVLPHELGHHFDRMADGNGRDLPGGEPFAENYALWALDHIWPRYAAGFEF